MDDPKCADILAARFKERNLRLNTRDRAANAQLKARIPNGVVAMTDRALGFHVPVCIGRTGRTVKRNYLVCRIAYVQPKGRGSIFNVQ